MHFSQTHRCFIFSAIAPPNDPLTHWTDTTIFKLPQLIKIFEKEDVVFFCSGLLFSFLFAFHIVSDCVSTESMALLGPH